MRSANNYRGAFDQHARGWAEFISASVDKISGRFLLSVDCRYAGRTLICCEPVGERAMERIVEKFRAYIAEHPNAVG